MPNVETPRTEAAPAAHPRRKPRFPLISTAVAASVAAGVLVGNAPATAQPVAAHQAPSKTKAAGSFSLAYVRVAGASRINQDGVTCYYGPVSFGIGLDGPKPGAKFSYRWIVDGKVFKKGTRRLPSYGRSDYFGSKKQVKMDLGTAHRVVFQLTSPQRRSKSAKWVMC
ncbi:hypothetical protein GCM10009733_050920 [Nonomuraea maheshkhaliensis]|uniref:DUF4822 domain-containing protein n=1 Tax=Nonomuraea maheshkhaliensis TaxID=419590 RepID=A0ABN2FHS0_9ACTN